MRRRPGRWLSWGTVTTDQTRENAASPAPESSSAAVEAARSDEQRQFRMDKRAALLETGRQAYPVEVPRTHTLPQVRDGWEHLETGEETEDVVSVTGRVVFVRNTGKLCFAALQDGARRLADRVRSQAPWAAPYLPHTGPIISGETVEPPSHGAARPQTTTTQKDTPA